MFLSPLCLLFVQTAVHFGFPHGGSLSSAFGRFALGERAAKERPVGRWQRFVLQWFDSETHEEKHVRGPLGPISAAVSFWPCAGHQAAGNGWNLLQPLGGSISKDWQLSWFIQLSLGVWAPIILFQVERKSQDVPKRLATWPRFKWADGGAFWAGSSTDSRGWHREGLAKLECALVLNFYTLQRLRKQSPLLSRWVLATHGEGLESPRP